MNLISIWKSSDLRSIDCRAVDPHICLRVIFIAPRSVINGFDDQIRTSDEADNAK